MVADHRSWNSNPLVTEGRCPLDQQCRSRDVCNETVSVEQERGTELLLTEVPWLEVKPATYESKIRHNSEQQLATSTTSQSSVAVVPRVSSWSFQSPSDSWWFHSSQEPHAHQLQSQSHNCQHIAAWQVVTSAQLLMYYIYHSANVMQCTTLCPHSYHCLEEFNATFQKMQWSWEYVLGQSLHNNEPIKAILPICHKNVYMLLLSWFCCKSRAVNRNLIRQLQY